MSWSIKRSLGVESLQNIPTPTIVEFVERLLTSSSSSSSTSSKPTKCTGANCTSSVSDNSLTIGLCVGIPGLLIVLVLSYFLFKNWRKEKKEMMEHDPDFDETGEATALPDFPRSQKQYEFEDPFHNRNSIRYPMTQYNKEHPSSSSASQTSHYHHNNGGDPYLDNIVLPYQHETGSKASLDEYAKNISEYLAYALNPRASTFMNSKTRTSTLTNSSNWGSFGHGNRSTEMLSGAGAVVGAAAGAEAATGAVGGGFSTRGNSTSPQKNRKFVDISKQSDEAPLSPTKNKSNFYSSIPNQSSTSFSQAEFHNAKESIHTNSDLESVSDSDGEAQNTSQVNKSRSEYEDSTTVDSYDTTREFTESTVGETIGDTTGDSDSSDYDATGNDDSFIPNPNVDNEDDDLNTIQEQIRNTSPFKESATAPSTGTNSARTGDDEDEEGFEFSQDSGNNDTAPTSLNAHHENLLSTSNDKLLTTNGSSNTKINHKSVRISDFNLLKNDSDDEDEGDKVLTEEQEEELKRMKSVYKVYFDRSKSMKITGEDGELVETDEKTSFPHDELQPIPELPHQMDYLKINKDLTSNTNYDKRNTTTSSIYTENPLFSKDEQQFIQQQQIYSEDPQYNYEQQYVQQPQYYQPHYEQQPEQPAQHYELPPLQQLPPPSDFRKSTIQSFTDFQPKPKNQMTNSPSISKLPFVPIENSNVWKNSPVSPVNSTHAFPNDASTSPQLGKQNSVPSATQLSRSSVVMLNPVTEITLQRKFKPAGSLGGNTPNGSATSLTTQSVRNQQYVNMHQHAYQQQGHQPPSPLSPQSNDLIPDGRNDVRRMMNQNF